MSILKSVKKVKYNVLIAFMSTFASLVSLTTIDSHATSTYYVRALFDEGSFGLVTQVIPDKSEGKDTLERDGNVNFSNILDYTKSVSGGSLAVDITKKDPESYKDDYKLVLEGTDANKGLTFSFPGITTAIDSTSKYTAMSADSARAELVANTLSKGANDALAFVKTYTKAESIGGEGLRIIADKLGTKSILVQTSGSDSFNTGGATATPKGFSIYKVTGPTQKTVWSDNQSGVVKDELIPVNGLRYSDYVVIGTTSNGAGTSKVYGYFPWRMEKGYYTGQALAGLVGSEYVSNAESGGKENKYLTWAQLFIQAGVNADVRGSTSIDTASDSMTLIGQGLGADLTNTISSVRSILNLAPIQELILNMGSRSSTHHYGVMTSDMYDTAKTVYVLVFCVSLLFLSVLVVKMIHQKMISTTNIIARTSLMEGLQDVVFVGVMLAIFPSIFELLLELNYWIVKTFSYSSSYLQAYGISGAKVLGMESLAGFVISSMFLSIDVYINTTYLVRAIAVSFLFAISPIMTISYAWGPTQKKLYFSYLRELVGNIFMQSFHAITMTFFAGYNTTNMSAMEAIASTYCFIPITQLFRSLVIGSQGGFSEQIGGKLAGQLTNTATGMHKANVSLKQGEQMLKAQAENSKAIADANWSAQKWGMGADLASMAIGKGLEIGGGVVGDKVSNLGGKMSSKSGSSNSFASKVGGALEKNGSGAGKVAGAVLGTAGGMAIGGALNKIGQDKVQGAHEKANTNLGQMQMYHSMENIGIGLAQAGIGMGVSSYDSGVGNSMISSGMSSVQSGAREYGEGKSLAGDGGALMAESKGVDTYAKNQGRTMMYALHTGANGVGYGLSTMASDNQAYNNKIDKMNKSGIDQSQASQIFGMNPKDSNGFGGNSPLEKIEMHNDNTTNATVTFNPKNMDNVDSRDSAMANLVSVLGDRDATAQARQDAIERARQEAHVSRTIDPYLDDNGKVKVVVENIGKNYGVYAEGSDIYASSSGLKDRV